MAPELLVAAGLCRSYTVDGRAGDAVREVSLTVAEAEVVAVLGRSGAGKTTLLRLCGGLERPDRGRVVLAGFDVARLAGRTREEFLLRTVGWVFQRPRLLPVLTALENVAIVLQIAGEPEAGALRSARVALQAVGLEERAGHRADELSAAERRRVALARALVKAPALLVADEPTAELDAPTAATVLALLRAAADSGTAVLLATHDPQAAEVADRVLPMEGGRLR